MNWLVYHIVSGQAFFSGVALMAAAAAASISSHSMIQRWTVLPFVVGATAAALSSTPLPYEFYGVAWMIICWWIVSAFRKQRHCLAASSVVLVCIVAAGLEVPWHITKTPKPVSDRSITVIGDSVTAGIGGDEQSETWPALLARQHQLRVQDISHVGETAASALKRTQDADIEGTLIIVEIGGNDILGSTTSDQFAHDLNGLLSHLASPQRQVLMFELPLPPFCHEFGRIQRTVAATHHVTLIPKRIFLSVIAGNESTLDSIHLSQEGHQLMADRVWQLVHPAFDRR